MATDPSTLISLLVNDPFSPMTPILSPRPLTLSCFTNDPFNVTNPVRSCLVKTKFVLKLNFKNSKLHNSIRELQKGSNITSNC